MSKIINTMVVIVLLGLAAVGFVILKFDDTTAAIIVLVPLTLHFLPRVAGHTVRALARHCRRVLRPYFTTSNKKGASSCRKIINTTAVIIALNCATLGITIGFAYAGVCTDQITQLRQAAQIAPLQHHVARLNAKTAGLQIVYDRTYPPSTVDCTPIVHEPKNRRGERCMSVLDP
jgi:hypothetical protein